MKTAPELPQNNASDHGLSVAELLAVVADLQQQLAQKEQTLQKRDCHITILEEQLRLKKVQQFAARSERHIDQILLFDEVEMESELARLQEQLPDELKAPEERECAKKKRQRGFAEHLVRERVELLLSDEEKAGANRTFFTKVKEELSFIPAQFKVIEYWQEKAVFDDGDEGESRVIAAKRPVHPLGKCQATPSLLTQIIISKYADGLPLYRQESLFARYGQEISRTSMAHWIIRLSDALQPLITLMREVQNDSRYLQADESRIQVLKEDGRAAQSNKWMWVIRGGPPDKPSVLFDYDPSRSGRVPVRLLEGFAGILQADGHSGYGQVCRENKLMRIGCWDHARRKFIEANKAAPTGKARAKAVVSKADMALSYIQRLYRIERTIGECNEGEKYRARQLQGVPLLNEFKGWLEKNVSKVMSGSLTRKAMEYTLNQWSCLTGYCDRGYLNISNALAENAIRPFAVGRKAWLFADTVQGARASAVCYSLIETAKANQLEPFAYIHHVLEHIAEADTLEKLEALLPWNAPLPSFFKKVPQYK